MTAKIKLFINNHDKQCRKGDVKIVLRMIWGQAAINYSYQQQMNKVFEEHVVKLDVQIKELHFAIVLPARITFSIQVDSKTLSQSRKVHYLEGQSFLPFQRHSCEFPVDFDTKKNAYLFKQISLVTHYQGAKGLQGSRRVKFDPFVKNFGDKEWFFPSQNSSEFKVVFVTSFSAISKKAKSSRVTSNANDVYKYTSLKKEANMDRKASAINELIKTDQASKRESQANNIQRQGYVDKTKRLEHIKSVPIQSKKRNTKTRLTTKFAEQSDQITTKPQDQLDCLRKKIQLQREEKVRSITKLKMEVSPNFLLQDKQEGEVPKLKDKIKNLQRKQKSLQNNIQQLNNELEKRNNKIIQLQRKKEELQKGIVDRDIKLKAANTTIRSLNQQIEGFVSKERVNYKKAQSKEAAFRDQLRKLQEKLKLSQLEIVKANQQKTTNIKGLQFCEKIHQNALKERQIKMSEQKSKFNKFRQEFSQKQKNLILNVQQLMTKIQNLQFQRNHIQERMNQLQQRQFNYENEIAALKQSIKLEREENDKKIDQNLAKINVDINIGRSKFNQINSQNNLLKQKVKRLQNIKIDNQGRIKELQESLKNKSTELSKMTTKMTLIKQQLDTSNDQNHRKAKQIESLKQNNASLKQKLIQSKEKGEEQKRAKDQANNILERQTNQFNKHRQSYESQIKELKWSIIRNNDSISELEYQIKQHNTTIHRLTEQQMTKSQAQSQLQDKLKQLEHQFQMIQRQKGSLLNRIKELNQNIKIKNMQLQQQKKQRIKAEHKYQEQRQKLRQNTAFSKERQAQQEQRKHQRQTLIIKKDEQISKLELQLTKKREEINSLKNSCDSVLREVHLSKMDNDAIKGELNILQSNYKILKQQNINLQQAQQQLTLSLTNYQQNSKMQNKKHQFLQKQYNQYKETIQRAFQNLCIELFKEQANSSNVIAASLLPFPTQKLSNLQVQLIQKRNNFIIKYRQKVSDLQNQTDALQHQIEQIRQLYQNREENAKQLDSEERQKLKGLLYEGMVEKNGLNEQLIMQRKEREQLQKEIQKLKVLMYKKQDIEQQLNGQLQIILLEYDGIKAENQDLNNIIFKYKTLQIQNKADYDRTITLLQEQSAAQIQKLKIQALDRQRKIIQVDKELCECNQKVRKIQEERYKSHGLLQMNKQSIRILQQKVSQCHLQITKLNNIIKGHQKKQADYKDIIDKLEGELAQQNNKAEILQNSLIKLTTQHFETNVEKERFIGELKNTKDKCLELQKMLHQKGETNKQKIQRKMQQNSNLKSNLIQKTSDLQLKDFYLKQKEQQYQALSQQNQQMKATINSLKIRVRQFNNLIQQNDKKSKELSKQIEQLIRQRQKKDQKLSESNFIIISLQSELEQMNNLGQMIQAKERQCIQLRQNKSQCQEYYMNELKKQKQTINELKRELNNERNNIMHLEEEYQNNLQSISKTNNQKYKYLQTQFMQEKDQFSKRVEQIETHNKKVVAEYQSRVAKLKQELYQCKEYQKGLSQQGYKKQSIIRSLSKKNQQLQNQLDDFKQKYNKYYQLYQENKAEIGQNAKENQSKLINTLEKSKISQIKQYNLKISQLQRKVDKLKRSQQFEMKSETISRREVKSIVERIFNRFIDILRESQLQNKQDLWKDSKVESLY